MEGMSGMLSGEVGCDGVGEHDGGHGGGALGVDVGEYGSVGLDEGGVAGHAHVGLHVGGGLAVGGEQMEVKL